MSDWKYLDEKYIMHTVSRLPIAIAKAEGNYLYDTDGKSYLDLFTGLAVNSLGHSHPRLMQTLQEQGTSFLHISNMFLNPPAIRLAERLVTHTVGTGKVFFCNSGAEATEALIKLVFKWSKQQSPDKSGIVVYKNSFHGRTLGAIRYTRQPSVYQDYPELNYPVYEIDSLEMLEEVCEKYQPAALLFEPILGAGGVEPLSYEFLHRAQELCQEKGMLFCLDEIQTGIGRTGTLFAYQQDQLQPDLLLFAKGIGGGLPLGGVIANERASEIFKPGDHGTTFAPSPLSAAMGNTVLDVLLDEGLLEQSKQMADILWDSLQQLHSVMPNIIQSIQGRGMMIGIHTHLTQEQVKKVQHKLLEQGILVNVTARTVIRLLPPLTLTKDQISLFIDLLQKTLKEIAQVEMR